MPDLEKVIKGLNEIGAFITGRLEYGQAKNFLEFLDESIALLKEQEAVEPKQIGHGWFCGACDSLLSIGNEKMVKFCSMCGKPIKWE